MIDNRERLKGMLPASLVSFAKVIGVDEDERLVKVELEPWGEETGWCKCLKDTFYLIPHHYDPDAPIDEELGQHLYRHEPKFPYKKDHEVLVLLVRGADGSGQYVVLGLIDQGKVKDQ